MKLQNISVSQAYASETNPRGNDFNGPALDDLVASVKEKGVLVPIIVRPNKKDDKLYEVVAGNRRFTAAQKAGLEEIPARVEEMSDEEAKEVQIIENLQREDVHPIEEGTAYRNLIENSKYDVKTIAARVGKSEQYVRYRLFLTNLTEKAAQAYRNGKFNDGYAVEIAKLSPDNQNQTVTKLTNSHEYNPIRTLKELKEYIKEKFYDVLSFQPWLKNEEANKAIGPCKFCPPNNPTLFGDVKEGACTSTKCWEYKMQKYIDFIVNSSEPRMTKVASHYGVSAELQKQKVLTNGQYEEVKKNGHCKFTRDAIIVDGEGMGKIIQICTTKSCKKHHPCETNYEPTPEEKEMRKVERAKELAKAKKKKAKEDKQILDALEKVNYPIKTNEIDIILDLLLCRSYVDEILKNICQRHGWDPVVEVQKSYMDSNKERNVRNWEKTARQKYVEMTDNEKMKLIFEIMLQNVWDEPRKKAIKALTK
ncbi:MAG: ParB/RepB/Spo0J family partition protein [Desulfobacteraceae bacterium]|nr:MAG: ParB/RepB/Spo0J family partition protein [Desulfobacteraceae bacterium]